jgi:hypothetical protein
MSSHNCRRCGQFRNAGHRCPPRASAPGITAPTMPASARKPSELTRATHYVPWVVKADTGPGSALLVYPDGSVRRKGYDEDGRGAGSSPVGRLERFFLRRTIREATDKAWADYDRENSRD